MKTIAVAVLILVLAAIPAIAATPQQQLAAQKVKYAKLQGQLAKLKKADAAAIATLTAQNSSLRAKVSAQASGGLTAVLKGQPTDMWVAVNALWQAFPKRADDVFCGFDKDTFVIHDSTSTSTSLIFKYLRCSSSN